MNTDAHRNKYHFHRVSLKQTTSERQETFTGHFGKYEKKTFELKIFIKLCIMCYEMQRHETEKTGLCYGEVKEWN